MSEYSVDHREIFTIYSEVENTFNESDKNDKDELGVKVLNKNNVVSGDVLRSIQDKVLKETSEYIAKSFGPMGSNTKIIKGTNQKDIDSSYSKDGLKILKNIINSSPIEASIVEELVSITRHVEKEVGDGTTSTVILSSFIFHYLMNMETKYHIPPYQLTNLFKSVVEEIKKVILDNKKDIDLDSIYDIAMISTNGNTEVAQNIRNIYEQYGFDVELNVGISNTEDSLLKVYDGLTITEGMSDPVFINNRSNNTSEIHNAFIYHFVDPIDDMNQIALFETILKNNIYDPLANHEDPVPTVITCPRLSKDMSATMKLLANQLYQFDQQNAEAAKPPILIITDVVASDELIMDDIANLCGCRSIHKYIDPNVFEKDKAEGKAPTVDNITDFAGHAELVIADAKKTKFINPEHMVDKDDPIYTAMVNFLETEIKNTESTDASSSVGLLKKRLSALKANMVDYLVGGVTIAERDAKKDLIEDAIKNCRSAAIYGYGYAANFEGLRAAYRVYTDYANSNNESSTNILKIKIAQIIFISYYKILEILYGSVCMEHEIIDDYIITALAYGYPYNISEGRLPNMDSESGKRVKCSIMLDINILDTIAKIITIMVTCNQCLLQSSAINTY